MIHLNPETVLAAREGDRAALEEIVRAAERPVYNLALRMLANPADAEDASQEILIKIVTHLGSLREVEAAGGWALRVACRHLVHERRRGRVEAMRLTFDAFAEDLADGAAPAHESGLSGAELSLAIKEVKIGCTLAMLVCLGRDLRIAYVLGDVFELTETEAAAVLEIAPATYRQRLKRARDRVTAFVARTCGIANDKAACRCDRRTTPALAQGRITRGKAAFGATVHGSDDIRDVQDQIRRLDQGRRAAALMRSNPDFPSEIGKLTLQVLDRMHDGDAMTGFGKT
ncbi:RNA polymerase sigma factor [Rhodobium gokarnense]|uniref:RNA polymerase sigma factor (Sigma-70 family) n=1 Tax=Rhodobium gokarnense TaxID=364296 RepID=A0ABT3HHE7_9HYPH|nr:RNA polymerase sigma factor [Rhodobium gokarnense]MCW2309835.1 RNA polymerase sigma factor (sigma-70 family) [Rhodobium gokarnense]